MTYGYLGAAGVTPSAMPIDVEVSSARRSVFIVDLPASNGQPDTDRTQVASKSGSARHNARGSRESKTVFLGSSEAARQIRELIQTASNCTYPVLITGETGVGKEVVARSIHALSGRSRRPLVVADCAATADSVLESELFGHARGSFTGAYSDRKGYFETAHNSTLFLDEVDSMSPRMQAALLRVLETGEYRPVGTVSHKRSDFRLVSAAMPRLLRLVESGGFRNDLFYRMSTIRIVVPPLRERRSDAIELAFTFARDLGVKIESSGLRLIEEYPWPGNVRQLRNCLEVATLSARDGRLGQAALGDAVSSFASRDEPLRAYDSAEAAWARSSEALQDRRDFGALEFARAAGVSRRSAQRHLARLTNCGWVMRIGAGRATRYRAARVDEAL